MDINTKMNMKKVLNYTKNIVLSLVVLFVGFFFVPIIGSLILGLVLETTGFGSPDDYWVLITLTPTSVHSWIVLLSYELVIFWPLPAFIIWIVRDSRKFKRRGVNTRPHLWGIGMIFPLILVAFPLYFIRRNITWLKEKEEMIFVNEDNSGLKDWYIKTDAVSESTKIKINKVGNALKWAGVILVGLFWFGVLFQIPRYIENKRTTEQVAKIHSTKLTMDDVMGKYLPPDPGTEADKTVAGIDANKNGIRDDVELAIFKTTLDNSIRTAQLQFARSLQVRLTNNSTNGDIELATFWLPDYGVICIRNIFAPLYIQAQKATGEPYDWEKVRPGYETLRAKEEAAISLVRDAMLNTEARKKKFDKRSTEEPRTYNQNYPVYICDVDDKALN